jgi:hypothetical protein
MLSIELILHLSVSSAEVKTNLPYVIKKEEPCLRKRCNLPSN